MNYFRVLRSSNEYRMSGWLYYVFNVLIHLPHSTGRDRGQKGQRNEREGRGCYGQHVHHDVDVDDHHVDIDVDDHDLVGGESGSDGEDESVQG